MALTKVINGRRITMSASEEAETLDQWALNDPNALPNIQQVKMVELEEDYNTAMEAGFVSDALGTPHWYDSSPRRTAMLTAAARRAENSIPAESVFSCFQADVNNQPIRGTVALRVHTADQINRVVLSGGIVAESHAAHLLDLLAKVQAATNAAEVQAIVWTNPAPQIAKGV